MKHYTYKIFNRETGQFYYGVRSCRHDIVEDYRYMGSSKHLSKLMESMPSNWEKIILKEHETREEAEAHEYSLTPIEVLHDPLCVNRARGGGGWRLMVPRGPMSEEHKQKLREAMSGKKLQKKKPGPRKKMELSDEERARRAKALSDYMRNNPKPRKEIPIEEIREATRLRVQKHRQNKKS